jgi:hypothetical protein
MVRVAGDIGGIFQREAKAVTEMIGGTAKNASDSAEVLLAKDAEGSMPALGLDSEPVRSVEQYPGLLAAGTGQRPPRIMYHYTSADGLEGILRSGKLRSSWRPGGGRGQFLTTIAPGTVSDYVMSDRIGMYTLRTHYVAIDVNRLRWKKPVELEDGLGDGNYMIRHRRSLRIRRLIVGSGENPDVPL